MSRGPRFLILLLLFALTFFGGIQWERQDCFVDWPSSMQEVFGSIRCPDVQPASSQPAPSQPAPPSSIA